ncbi:hypothetical protein [Actinomadura fibrosa]|uniref:ThuA-like domain-containing protein n=1 Tax=Actinomadura fibrosa TaxID=111802 RepID=A0ABW2XP77_9ACTN|nr:hypothetical protein [Actinomadura fibrosa]
MPDLIVPPPDWPRLFPWLRPAVVKILLYADGGIRFDGGPFLGLQQVISTLTSSHYPWVRFEVTTAHRRADPSTPNQNLTLDRALELDAFDELWLYSIESAPQLAGAELDAVTAFMNGRAGGVLITGDHANLGMAMGSLPRAGKMRRLPAPDAAPPGWNTTLRSGADTAFQFDDQSDSTPQPLRLRRRWAGPFLTAPHPLLCSPAGPIDIFPDHQHEGEAVAPAMPPQPTPEWPAGAVPQVVAWGTIVDPSSNTPGREVGVLSAYEGHAATVGRIVADSTWHHHFDINLRGLPGVPDRTGFTDPVTHGWLPQFRKIEHFFVNSAIWLAPPGRQAAMRAARWWQALWSDPVIELAGQSLPVQSLGRAAVDALGRYAPQCLVFDLVWHLVPIRLQKAFQILIDKGDPPPLFEIVAGVALARLITEFKVSGSAPLPDDQPRAEQVEEILRSVPGLAVGHLVEMQKHALEDAEELSRTVG